MVNDQERAAFEAWATANDYPLDRDGEGGFDWPDTRAAWLAWQSGRAAPAAAPQVPAVPQWQPIETAPKSGLADILNDGRRYAGCHYDRICDEWRHITACGVLIHLKKATHWMPLPASPSAATQPAEPHQLVSDTEYLRLFEQARAGSDKPAGTLRGIRACIAAYEDATPQPAERVPLTVPEILEFMPDEVPASYDGQLIEFARAIEAAISIRAAGVKEPLNAEVTGLGRNRSNDD